MSCIHFKFKSSLEYEKLTFEGLHISLSDLKEAIMKQKKIGSFNQYTLSIVDAQSKKEYRDDQEMIPRNSSVIISRVPVTNPIKLPKTQRKDPSLPQPASVSMAITSASSSIPPPLTSQRQLTAVELQETADLASAHASEEDKMKAMMTQSSKDYDPSRYVSVASKGPSLASLKKNPPPPTYICHRCGKRGHWIQFCPTNGDPNFDNRSFKRSLGTPSTQVISAGGNMTGVMMDRHGNLVMRKVDYTALMSGQSKAKPEAPIKLELPTELTCPICKKLVKDAVIIQCCSESFCYECIQEYLCENEFTCPLCKATDVSPETLVPNKALRTAAKNFQMKEMEQKSVSEARGYVPVVPPHQPTPLSVPSHPTMVDPLPASTSGAGTASVVPGGAPAGKEKEEEEEEKINTTSGETESEPPLAGAEKDTLSVKTDEEKPQPSEKHLSPTPQLPKHKNRSEVLLDRILSTKTSKRTPPPPTVPAPVTIPASSKAVPSIPPVAPPTLSNAILGAPSVAVSATLTAPVMAASALLSGGGILGLSRGPTKSTLPGQGAVLTTSAVIPQVVIPDAPLPQEDTAKLERIAAELLLSATTATKKSASPTPLSAEEFYRQQKMLKLFAKQTWKRTPSPYSVSGGSRSTTPDSYFSHRTRSDSGSMSRSHSPSGSSYSDSRSRSRSPISNRHSHRSKKHRSYHKREKPRRERSTERSTERGKERKSTHHSKRKRKRHLSPERESKSKHSKSRHRVSSPDRKKYRDNHTPSSVALENVLSPDSSLGSLTPEMEVDAVHSKSSSRHRRHHKRKSKPKHRRRERGEEMMETESGLGGRGGKGEPGLTRERVKMKEARLEVGEDGLMATGEGKQPDSQEVKEATEESVDRLAKEKGRSHLVPYQDSSTTEAEGVAEERSAAAATSLQATEPDTSSDQTVTETDTAAVRESTVAMVTGVNHESSAGDPVEKEGELIDDGEKGSTNEGEPPLLEAEQENNEAADDTLMISLHVDDTIDGTPSELLDAACPPGREDGELTDSDKEYDNTLFADKAEPHSSSQSCQTTSAQRSSASDSVGSVVVAPPTSGIKRTTTFLSDEDTSGEKDDDVDLRVILEKQKSKKHKTSSSSKKQFPSSVMVASGSSALMKKYVPPSQSQSSAVDNEWSSDEEEDSESSEESGTEVGKKRTSKSTSNSKHSLSSSIKKYKRKHSSKTSRREKEKEKEKKRKRPKEHKVSSEAKKKPRKERERVKEKERDRAKEKDREKEKERERMKKRKKHKKSSEKYTKY